MSSTDRDQSPPTWIYPSFGEAEAVQHPSADSEVVDFRYRRDDPDDPLVRMSEVADVVFDAVQASAQAGVFRPQYVADDVLDRIRRNLEQPTEDRQEGSSDD